MVRIDPCHGSDPGSIPGSFDFYLFTTWLPPFQSRDSVFGSWLPDLQNTKPQLGCILNIVTT